MGIPVVFITEPLLDVAFTQYRTVVPIAALLSPEFEVAITAPAISESVASDLERLGLTPLSGGVRFPPLRNSRDEVPSFVMSWARDALLSLNRRGTARILDGEKRLRVNISMTNSSPADVWYVQSRPLGESLASIRPNLNRSLRLAIGATAGVVNLAAEHHLGETAGNARRILSSTEYVAGLYRRRGFTVSGMIPAFLYPPSFGPTSAHPRRDYILAYLGKETDMAAVNDLVRLGFPVRLFGGKSAQLVQSNLDKPLPANLDLVGAVTHERLLDLYTHALFTAFPFTDESFGLVPIESMACGTPVLTYGAQGPGETVLDGATGWLEPNKERLVERAREIVSSGYPVEMSSACVRRSDRYKLSTVVESWKTVLREGASLVNL